MVFDDIMYREASDLVRGVELDWIDFELFNIPYALRMCESKNEDGSQNGLPAEYHFHENGMCGVYIWEEIGEKIQRPLLLHEIVEIYHKLAFNMSKTEAHNAALPWEKRFCDEFHTPVELEQYLMFKKQHGYNGFDLVKSD